MQITSENRELEYDRFSQAIRDKLVHYQWPVEDSELDEIKQRLRSKRRIALWTRLSGGAVAAAIALLFILQPFSNHNRPDLSVNKIAENGNNPIEKQAENTKKTVSPEITTTTPVNERPPVSTHSTAGQAPKQVSNLLADSRRESADDKSAATALETAVVEQVEEPEITVVEPTTEEPAGQPSAQTAGQPKDKPAQIGPPKENNTSPSNLNGHQKESFQAGKKTKNVLLAAAFGTGGHFPSPNNSPNMNMNDPDYNSPGINSPGKEDPDDDNHTGEFYPGNGPRSASINFPGQSAPENVSDQRSKNLKEEYPLDKCSDVTHYTPISFGLSVRKPLNNRWAVETGLTYTFLYSRFRNQNPAVDASIKMHYIGVPLNMALSVLDKRQTSKWDVYLLAGGMIEKGFHLDYNATVDWTSQTHTVHQSGSISGLQGSLHAALGVSYRIYRDIDLYIEPRVTYYLDNNQPASIRTEHPFFIGFGTGLRFNINK
jgi:hypothetical protein